MMTHSTQELLFDWHFWLPTKFWWRFLPVSLVTIAVFALIQLGTERSLEAFVFQLLLPLLPPIGSENELALSGLGLNRLGLLLLFVGMSLGLAMGSWRLRYQLGVWVGLCVGWGALGDWLWQQGYKIPIAAPILLFSLCGVAVTVAEVVRIYLLLRQSEKRYALTRAGNQ